MNPFLICFAGVLSVGAATLPDVTSHDFKNVAGSTLRLHIYAPQASPAAVERPAIVFFFGGGWERGSPTQFMRQATHLASRGMVAVCPEYRTRQSHGTTPFECLADGKDAVRWVRSHAKELGVDPQRIAAGGGSAGGYVAAAAAVLSALDEPATTNPVSCVPNALVLFNPVLDTTATGYGAKKFGARSREASPAHNVRAGLPPTVIFHGRADTTVPFENAQRFTDEMRKAGNACTLRGYDGQGHGFYLKNASLYPVVLQEMDAFFVSLGWLAAPAATASTTAARRSVIVDDEAAVYTGTWVSSRKQTPQSGSSYRHDGAGAGGDKTACFTPDLPAAGDYAVRLLYPPVSKSATNVKVAVRAADGEKIVTVNQRDAARKTLGVFRFDAGKTGSVSLSTAGADGFVVIDGVEFAPADGAPAEPAASAADGKKALPAVRAVAPKPLQVKPVRASTAQEVSGKTYDLVVVGGTPGGIACAVRAAREGLSVLLVQHNRHIGGMLSNALMQWDALYAGHRAPVFNEYAHMLETYYLDTYGASSPQYSRARFTQTHYPMALFEPSVAEHHFNRLVSAETNITTLLSHYPAAAARKDACLKALTLREYGTTNDITARGGCFVDATYEGDLAALANVPYRVGREGRDEYGEPHAGRIFTNIAPGRGPKAAVEGKLDIHPYHHKQGSIDPDSPYTADGAIQAFNYRFCLARGTENRRLPDKPPAYNRDEYVSYNRKGMAAGALNNKSSFNNPILPGENHAYPDADWPTREKIIERHKNFALGLMYFLQNDASLSEAKREGYRQIGLPLDEYPDNANIPYEMYVREARRIVGRHVFKEQDNTLAPAYARTPVFADSIAITDWSMDSHDCTTNRRPGYAYDGKLILTDESHPAQIPYRALLPQGVDNLLVPVCLSATHVAWGAVRLEPVFMHVGEAAGFAAALAKRLRTAPAQLDPDRLVRELCRRRMMVTFFNKMNVASDDPRVAAAQYFGTQGFFADYDARLDEPLSADVQSLWLDAFEKLRRKNLDPAQLAAAVHAAEAKNPPASDKTRGDVLLQLWKQLSPP